MLAGIGAEPPPAARLKTLPERPVFEVERSLSNAWRIRGSRDLGHADVGVRQHRLGGLDVVVREFRRLASGAASAPRGGKPRLGALPDQAALEFRQRAEHVKDQPPLRGCNKLALPILCDGYFACSRPSGALVRLLAKVHPLS